MFGTRVAPNPTGSARVYSFAGLREPVRSHEVSMISRRAVLPLALLVSLLTPNSATAAQRPGWFSVSERGLVGTLGPLRVRMMISTYGHGTISGSYYIARDEPFARNFLTDISVRGTIDREGHFRMEESAGESFARPDDDEDEQPGQPAPDADAAAEDPLASFGVFTGTLTHGPRVDRPSIRLEGTWTLPDGTHPVPFSLAEVPIPKGVRIVPRSFHVSTRRPMTAAGASYPSIVGHPAFERANLSVIRSDARDLRTYADQELEGVDPNEPSTLDIDYEITYASATTVSVMFRAHYWYTVYVTHDQLEQFGATYDYRRGKWVTLADIFGADYYKTLGPVVRDTVKGTYWDGAVKGAQDEVATADFYLVEGGVMLLFPTDRSTGHVIEVFIPHKLP